MMKALKALIFLLCCFSLWGCHIFYAPEKASFHTQAPTLPINKNKADVVTPLIESFSVTLYGFERPIDNEVWYRKKNEHLWRQGYSLQWDPIGFAMSGSVVHLKANTHYEVKVVLLEEQDKQIRRLQTTTRANTPPINPKKVFYLKDLHKGGSFDLTAHNIQGSKNGWAVLDGKDVVLTGDLENDGALNIGDAKYVLLRNITIKGGKRYGIYGNKAHHIWIDGCDISRFGRANAYTDDNERVNYDAGIFLKYSGSVVVENCDIHSPNLAANTWDNGHPKGASAMLISAKHPNEDHQGQYIIRHNRFYGSDNVRFNDVIESRANGRAWGGFLRDSAIHDNYIAYANDDIIELDGGQHNVLVYNNDISQAYCGISLVPNMRGPVYVFNNHIHQLFDQRKKNWAAFKMGGLRSAPKGKALLFHNLVEVQGNIIATGAFKGDKQFWVEATGNIFRSNLYRRGKRGYAVRATQPYDGNRYSGNLVFNLQNNRANYINDGKLEIYLPSDRELSLVKAGKLRELNNTSTTFLQNFSQLNNATGKEIASGHGDKASDILNTNRIKVGISK